MTAPAGNDIDHQSSGTLAGVQDWEALLLRVVRVHARMCGRVRAVLEHELELVSGTRGPAWQGRQEARAWLLQCRACARGG